MTLTASKDECPSAHTAQQLQLLPRLAALPPAAGAVLCYCFSIICLRYKPESTHQAAGQQKHEHEQVLFSFLLIEIT